MATLVKRPSVGVLVCRSAAGTRNLSVLAAALLCAMVAGSVGLTVVAVWLYGLFVARDVSSPRFAKRVSAARAEARRRLPDGLDLADPGLRVAVSSIRAGYAEIARVLERTPSPIQAHVRAAVAALNELRPQAARLIREADELCGYLRAVPRSNVASEVDRLAAAAARATDEARAEYERALAIRRDQLAALDQIQREHDRIAASLERIIGTVEAFPARIYRLRLLERSAREDPVSDADRDLQRMNEDLSSSQQLLESLAARDGASWSSLD
ncbi:MAG TPA: hypothetical protein VGL86_07510 [Polyangia bacterium]|jgi:hypothetical protein